MESRKKIFQKVYGVKEFFLLSVVFFIYCLLVWSDFIVGLRLPFHDTIGFFYPVRKFFSDCIQQNVIPLWDYWDSPGFPTTFFTEPLWNPIAYLFSLVKNYNIYRLMAEFFFLSFLSATGFYYWLRQQRISLLFSLCGAAAWISSAPFLTSIQGFTIYTTITFIPWIFLGVTLILEPGDQRNFLVGIVVTSISVWIMVAGGYTGLTVPVFFFVLIYTVFLFCLNYKHTLRIGLGLFLAGVLSFLLIAGPISDYLHVKDVMLELRGLADGGYNPFTSSLPINSMWTLLLGHGGYLPNITIGRAEQLYMSAVLFLVIPGCLFIVKLVRKDLFFFCLTIFIFLSAMGTESPVARFVMTTVPLMSLFRHHVFWSSIVVFLLLTLSLRLLHRLVENKEMAGISFFKIWGFYSLVIGAFIAGGLNAFYSGPNNAEHYIFSSFEIIEYVLSILLFVYILFFIVMKDRISHGYLAGYLSILVLITSLSILYLIYFNGLDMLSAFAGKFGGVFTYVEDTRLALRSKLLVHRISLPPTVIIYEDLIYLFVLSAAFLALAYRYFQSKKKVWVYCFVLIVAVDMVCSSHRYFQGNLQYLGNTAETSKYLFKEKEADVSNLVRTQDDYYSVISIDSGILKGDLIKFQLEMHEKPDPLLTIYIIIYKNGSSERVIEAKLNSNNFDKMNRIDFSGIARASLPNFTFEIRYHNCKSPPQPLIAKLSLYRTVPAYRDDTSERTLDYTRNFRLMRDGDRANFYYDRTPVMISYKPLFDPKIRNLANETNGSLLFSKLLWTIPLNTDVDLKSWAQIAKEPIIKSMHLSPNSMQADIIVDKPSKLIWTDAWDSGWSATLNGEDIAIEKFIGSLKSLTIPEGKSLINFSYKRKERQLALILTFIGIIGVVILMGITIFNKKWLKFNN